MRFGFNPLLPQLVAILWLLSGRAYAGDKTIALLDCAKEPACVPMLLGLSDEGEHKLIAARTEKPGGNTLFEIHITGTINGKTGALTVYFLGYTDGIACSSFGQGNVGFLGYSPKGNPIIKTSQGPLEVLDDRMEVGCKDCLERQDDKGQVIESYITSSWDPELTGNKDGDFSADLSGNELVKSGSECLEIPKNALVRAVSPKRCEDKHKARVHITSSACT